MTTYAVIDVESVLMEERPSVPLQEREASLEAKRLYAALATQYNLILVHDREPLVIDHWLKVRGFRAWSLLLKGPITEVLPHLRTTHGALGVWVTGNAAEGRYLLREGVTCLLLGQAGYQRSEWRPDHQRVLRSWEVLREEMELTQKTRDEDERLRGEYEGRFE